jgi:hypothetical protein
MYLSHPMHVAKPAAKIMVEGVKHLEKKGRKVDLNRRIRNQMVRIVNQNTCITLVRVLVASGRALSTTLLS